MVSVLRPSRRMAVGILLRTSCAGWMWDFNAGESPANYHVERAKLIGALAAPVGMGS
jgi:hypothetical protein